MSAGLDLLGEGEPVPTHALRLAATDVAQAGDRLGFLVGPPLRVRDSKATLSRSTAVGS